MGGHLRQSRCRGTKLIAAKDSALQHHRNDPIQRTPRPLPLFLDMVRRIGSNDPDLSRRALEGLRVYAAAERIARDERPTLAARGRVRLVDGGGSGAPVVMVPSLINPSQVLDLAPGNSLCDWLAQSGFHPLLIDWGDPGQAFARASISDHIVDHLLPLIDGVGEPVHLVGYCLGGTMALAASRHVALRSLTLLATPWHFDRYDVSARAAAADVWRSHRTTVAEMGCMPVELLQTLFWAIDEHRAVAKYAALSGRSANDPHVRAFAVLEDWSNSGAPLTEQAAIDLFETLIIGNQSGTGVWQVADGPVGMSPAGRTPALHFTATGDRIAPNQSAPDGITTHQCPSGHVGMVVGGRAQSGLWQPLSDWLRANDPILS